MIYYFKTGVRTLDIPTILKMNTDHKQLETGNYEIELLIKSSYVSVRVFRYRKKKKELSI